MGATLAPVSADNIGIQLMIAGPEDPNGGGGEPFASKAETLTYLSDIIFELKQLADRSGCRTLGAILNVALLEARIQDEQLRR